LQRKMTVHITSVFLVSPTNKNHRYKSEDLRDHNPHINRHLPNSSSSTVIQKFSVCTICHFFFFC
jgi:hypothetical protein